MVAVSGCAGGGSPSAAQPGRPTTTAPVPSPTASTARPITPSARPTITPSATPSARPRSPQARPSTPRPRPTGTRYAFPIAGCRSTYGHTHHDYPATDVFAALGCIFVSPVTGRVDEVTTVDRWDPGTNRGADRGGRSVSVVGRDGVRYYGSHLSAIASGIRPGLRVSAGQPLGRIGNSGSARGIDPHLHFGLSWPTRPGVWWVRRGEVYPWPYLDAWRDGRQLSPAAAVAARRAAVGTVPPCPAYC